MALKLFFDGMSQPSRSVMLFLKLNNIAYTSVLTNIAAGDHLTDDYKKINPSGKVPAIQHGDFPLFESTAILKYLCANFNIDQHWYPPNLQQRAKIDEYLSWHHTNLRLGAAMLFQYKVLRPMFTGKPPQDSTKWLKLLNKSLTMFDNYFLANSNFISSNEITIADLMAMEEFIQLEVMGANAPPLTKKVEEWISRCKDATKQQYDEVHVIHGKMKQKLAKL